MHLYGCHCNETAVICLIKEGVATFSSTEEVQVWLVGNETTNVMSQTYLKERNWLEAKAADHKYFEAQVHTAFGAVT